MPIITSSPGPVESATLETTSWWLKNPADEATDLAIRVESFDKRKLKESAKFTIHGRAKPVVLRGTVNAIAGSLRLRTHDEDEYDALEALLDAGATLLLQNVIGQQWYVEVDGEIPNPQRLAQATAGEAYPVRHFHNWTVPVVEVDEPT